MPARLRLPVAIIAALAVAEVAVFLLRPRDPIEPVAADPARYFTPGQLERAVDFRDGQFLLYLVRMAVELGVLVYVVRRPPLRLPEERPVLVGAGVAAGLSVALTVVTLPVSAIARSRAIDVGLITQSWGGWAWDVVRGTAIDAGLWAAGGALLVVAMRRFGRRWWVPGAVAIVGFGAAVTTLAPIVLDPLFNDFKRLPQGELRRDVIAMAERAGVSVGEVYEMDASRRTTAANAYVTGLGRTKRVVLYDTLLRDFTAEEVRLVVAHELGHVHYHDVPRGILYLALVTPLGAFAAARLGERFGGRLGTAAAVPGTVLAIAIVTPAITMISNQLSRAVEARADTFALELTDAPDAQIAFQRRIALQNVSDPAPPPVRTFLLATHPTTMQRIGLALAFE